MQTHKGSRLIITIILFLFSCIQSNSQDNLQKGIKLYKNTQLDSAEFYLLKAEIESKSKNDIKSLIQVYNNLGNIEADRGNNVKSLERYQQALKIAEQGKDDLNITHLNKNIGALYLSWKRLDEALEYYLIAEKSALQFKDKILIADCNNNIGTVYEQQNKFDSAVFRYEKALRGYQENQHRDGIAMSYSNLAIVYKLKGDYEKSIFYNQQSLKLSEDINDLWMQAATLNNIGNLYNEIGDYIAAEENCLKALKLSRQIKALEIVYNVYENLAIIYQKKGSFELALINYKKFTEVKDSFLNEENQRVFTELEAKYKSEKREWEIRNLKLDNKIKTVERNEAEKEKYYLIGIFSLIVLILSFVLYISRQRRKQSDMHKMAALQSKASAQIYEAEIKERTRIAQDLHDSVGQKMMALKMYVSDADQNKKINQLLDDAISEVRSVSHNLFPEIVNLGLAKSLENIADKINLTSTIQCQLKIDQQDVNLDKSVLNSLYKIIQEITSNMMQHAKCSVITIQLKKTIEGLVFIISDNGVGFDTRKIFLSEGLGWQNIMARIKMLRGSINISCTSNGTMITFTIPNE